MKLFISTAASSSSSDSLLRHYRILPLHRPRPRHRLILVVVVVVVVIVDVVFVVHLVPCCWWRSLLASTTRKARRAITPLALATVDPEEVNTTTPTWYFASMERCKRVSTRCEWPRTASLSRSFVQSHQGPSIRRSSARIWARSTARAVSQRSDGPPSPPRCRRKRRSPPAARHKVDDEDNDNDDDDDEDEDDEDDEDDGGGGYGSDGGGNRKRRN